MPMEYNPEAEDKWLKWKGQKPATRIGHGLHDDDEEIAQKLADNLAGHRCDWRQNGSEIYCEAGQYRHGKRIGTRVRLAGTDENGEPVLVPVGAILRSEVESGSIKS